MRDRLRKKAGQRRMAGIHEILDLVLDINGLQESEKDITGNHPTALLYFYGHTGQVEVDICREGWEPDADYDVKYTFPIYARRRLYRESTLEETIQGLRALKKDPSGSNRRGVQDEKLTHPYYKWF